MTVVKVSTILAQDPKTVYIKRVKGTHPDTPMKFQVIRPFSIVTKGKSKTYMMGQRISETAYHNLSQRQQGYLLSARAASGRVPYTREEITCIVSAYLQNDNRIFVKETFEQNFPKSRHTSDSVMFQACLLENLDNTKPSQSGSYHITNLVVQVAQEIDSKRFGNSNIDSKLDILLASL